MKKHFYTTLIFTLALLVIFIALGGKAQSSITPEKIKLPARVKQSIVRLTPGLNRNYNKYIKFPYKLTFKDSVINVDYRLHSLGINDKTNVFQYNLYSPDGELIVTAGGDTNHEQISFVLPAYNGEELSNYYCTGIINKDSSIKGICETIAINNSGALQASVESFIAIPTAQWDNLEQQIASKTISKCDLTPLFIP